MQVKFFTVPVDDNGQFENELNTFLKQHKVLETQIIFNATESAAAWHVCVRYTEGALPVAKNISGKIDYKEVLEPAVFNMFSQLRAIRKQLAAADAVPAYAVFTDEELVALSRLPALNKKNILSINGIGEKKMEKYGLRLIEMLNQLQNEQESRGTVLSNS